MSKGFFTDKNSKPSDADILNIVGKARDKWEMLYSYMTHESRLKEEMKFYGINYGWALRFSRSGKYNITLYPDKDCFTLQIILNKNQVESALMAGLDPKIVSIINDTQTIYEGKWIYMKIHGEFDMKDIIKLIDIRVRIK